MRSAPPSIDSIFPTIDHRGYTRPPTRRTYRHERPSFWHPLPASISVLEARDVYLRENGFTLESYDDDWTPVVLMGLRLGVPNTRRHRWAIMLHDLHHVATGYGTDLQGEAEVSAWELKRGLRGVGLYVGSIVTTGALFGIVHAPRHTLKAWRAPSRSVSLFASHDSYDALLTITVGALREKLGLPREGLAVLPRGLHDGAPRTEAPE